MDIHLSNRVKDRRNFVLAHLLARQCLLEPLCYICIEVRVAREDGREVQDLEDGRDEEALGGDSHFRRSIFGRGLLQRASAKQLPDQTWLLLQFIDILIENELCKNRLETRADFLRFH